MVIELIIYHLSGSIREVLVVKLRHSSDVMFLSCRTLDRPQHGRHKTLMQTQCQSCTKFRISGSHVTILIIPCRNAFLPKHTCINTISEFYWVWQKHDIWIAVVPEFCSTPELLELSHSHCNLSWTKGAMRVILCEAPTRATTLDKTPGTMCLTLFDKCGGSLTSDPC